MKKLFYLVLVLNAGFFVWIYTQQEQPVRKADIAVAQKPSLALLEEAGSAGSVAVTKDHVPAEQQPTAKTDSMPGDMAVREERKQDVPAQKTAEMTDVAPQHASESASPEPVVSTPAQTEPPEKLVTTTETGTLNVAATAAVDTPLEETVNCFELGSFPTMIVADKISTQFRNAGVWAESRLDIQEQKQGHIIYIPTQGSYDRANQIIASVKEKGITDYAILAVDGVRNTVVMGIYRTDSAAARRLAHLKENGFDARIKEHIRKRPRYMVDFRESDSKPVPEELWSRISHDYPEANRAARTCE